MKLLWITENFPPSHGGMAVSAHRIVSNLRTKGVDIDVVHLRHSLISFSFAAKTAGYYPLSHEHDEAHTLNMLNILVEKLCSRKKYDYMVAFGGFLPMNAVPVLSAWYSVPYALLIRGNDFDSSVFSSRKMHILHRAIENATLIASVAVDKVHKVSSFWKKSVSYIPNGINTELWQLLPSDIAHGKKIREELQAENLQVLGVFGHLKPKKGMEMLFQALCDSHISSQLVLYMVGSVSPELIEHLQNSGIKYVWQQQVRQDELPAHYSACNAVVLPSLYDGMPNVALEALSLGIPLMAADISGLEVFFNHADCGWMFHKADVADLKRALLEFLQADAQQYKLKSENAVHLATHFYSQEIETNSYLSFFNSQKIIQ